MEGYIGKLFEADQYIKDNKNTVGARYRNRYHAMPPVGWMNDPNGFIYAFGKYHLFYQHHPYSALWGPMHWGHFTSDDLVVWRDEPVALAPDMPYDDAGCFSGSSLEKENRLYVMYTSVSNDRQTQALAVSLDGVGFEKLGCVIDSDQVPEGSSAEDFRDAKLFEHGGTYYCMVGSKAESGCGQILLYRSADLMNWNYAGIVRQDARTNICECPDYFGLGGKEILVTSPQNVACEGIRFQNQHSNIYIVGKLDFQTGSFESEYEDELDCGFDFYAAQTLRTPDGRRVLVAWMSMWDRTNVTAADGWAGAMTLPRELTLRDGRIYQQPVREIERYRKRHYQLEQRELCGGFSLPDLGAAQEITVIFDTGTAQRIGVKIFCGKTHETLVYYDRQKDCIVFDRSNMGTEMKGGPNESDASVRYGRARMEDGILTMRLFLDVSSCEAFFGEGECVMTANIYAAKEDRENLLFAEGGLGKILRLDAYSLEINQNKLEEEYEKVHEK